MHRPSSIIGLLFALAKARGGRLLPCVGLLALFTGIVLVAVRTSAGVHSQGVSEEPPSSGGGAIESSTVESSADMRSPYSRVSPDGSSVVVLGHGTPRARVWDLWTGAPRFSLDGHTSEIRSVAYRPDGAELVTASYDGTARVWDARTGKPGVSIDPGGWIFRAQYSPDGLHIVTFGGAGGVRVWAGDTGRLLYALVGERLDGIGSSVQYFPDSTQLLTVGPAGENLPRVWEARTGALRFALADPGYVSLVSADGSRVLTAGDTRARLWDGATGGLVATLAVDGAEIYNGKLSRDGRTVLTTESDKRARLWDARTGALRQTLTGHRRRIWTAELSPDGTRVVTASADFTAGVWDVRTGTRQLTLDHERRLHSATFSPGGDQVVTKDSDMKFNVWSARTGKLQFVLANPREPPESLEYARAGTRIVTTGVFGSVRVMNAKTGVVIHEFNPDR